MSEKPDIKTEMKPEITTKNEGINEKESDVESGERRRHDRSRSRDRDYNYRSDRRSRKHHRDSS